MTDRQQRETALTLLSVKTQAAKFDAFTMTTYLDDSEILAFDTVDVIAACKSLEKGDWFPKFGELVKACKIAQYHRAYGTPQQQADRAKSLGRGPMTPLTEEQSKRILNKLYEATHLPPPAWLTKPSTEDETP